MSGASDSWDVEEFRSYLLVVARARLHPLLQAKVAPSDVVQQTLLEAYQGLEELRACTRGQVMAWLRQVLARNLLNHARDFQRDKRDVKRERSLDQLIDNSAMELAEWLAAEQLSPEDQAQQNEESLRVTEAIAQLPEPQRTVIVLRHCHGWSLSQIGEHLQRSSTAVAGLLYRGLEQLRRQFREKD